MAVSFWGKIKLDIFGMAKLGFLRYPFSLHPFCWCLVRKSNTDITMPHRLLEESLRITDVALFDFSFNELPVIAKR